MERRQLYSLPSAVTRTTGPLEVEAAKMARDIDHLTDEIKTGHFAALHALGGEFVSADAASGDLSFSIAFSANRNNLPIVGTALKFVKRVIAPACRRIEIEPAIGQPVGQSGPESSLCG